jgi:hypothetical protein
MSETRPISTPLKVTLEPGSIDNPDRDEISVNFSGSLKPPRNWTQTSDTTVATPTRSTRPEDLTGGSQRQCRNRIFNRLVK